LVIVVVGGSGKDVGKTGLVCALIATLREFDWTAVKITGHDYAGGDGSAEGGSGAAIREETEAGEGTDTGRYLAAGARRALLVTRAGEEIPIAEIRSALGSDRNVMYESNRIAEVVEPDVCLALVGGHERKASFERLLRVADAVVTLGETDRNDLAEGVALFELETPDRLSTEMVTWVRQRLMNAG